MRTIAEIKESIAEEFMRNESAAKAYGFEAGEAFSAVFSRASVENVLMYVFAVAAWTLETLLSEHKSDVSAQIEAILPHRPKWYRDKMLKFMVGKELVTDSDEYDTTGMSDAEIDAARIVKHAVAVENEDASILTIKVAGENGNGERQPLNAAEERQLRAYIAEIKDAGVRTDLVNADADRYNCEIDVYYNPLLQPSGVETECREAIKVYIENLPFNGEYTNMALIDTLQGVEGVKIAELKRSTAQAADESTVTAINARITPRAGYFKTGEITLNMIAYDEREI